MEHRERFLLLPFSPSRKAKQRRGTKKVAPRPPTAFCPLPPVVLIRVACFHPQSLSQPSRPRPCYSPSPRSPVERLTDPRSGVRRACPQRNGHPSLKDARVGRLLILDWLPAYPGSERSPHWGRNLVGENPRGVQLCRFSEFSLLLSSFLLYFIRQPASQVAARPTRCTLRATNNFRTRTTSRSRPRRRPHLLRHPTATTKGSSPLLDRSPASLTSSVMQASRNAA